MEIKDNKWLAYTWTNAFLSDRVAIKHKERYRLHFETNGHCRIFEKSSGKLVYSGDIVEINQWLEENDK